MTRFGITIALAATFAAAVSDGANSRDRSSGANEYRISCAGCHGPDGRGDGPAARSLPRRPTDLTKLEERNDYEFPYLKVFQVIDGRTVVVDHGTREMPVWGRRYLDDIGESRGPYGGEAAVRKRIEALVRHVQALQER